MSDAPLQFQGYSESQMESLHESSIWKVNEMLVNTGRLAVVNRTTAGRERERERESVCVCVCREGSARAV